VRDFIHIADAVEAYLLALRRMQSGVNATYLLGTGQPSSIQQLVDLAAQVTHCPIPSSAGEPLAMQPAAVYADPSDARRTLQWAPRYDLRQIIESEWLWTTKHFEPFLLSRAGDAKR
jgi:UDP-glucose 4-epimerase